MTRSKYLPSVSQKSVDLVIESPLAHRTASSLISFYKPRKSKLEMPFAGFFLLPAKVAIQFLKPVESDHSEI